MSQDNGYAYAPPITKYKTILPEAIYTPCLDQSYWNLYFLSNPNLDVDLDIPKPLQSAEYLYNIKCLGLLDKAFESQLPTLYHALVYPPEVLQREVQKLELWNFEYHVGDGWWQTFSDRLTSHLKVKPLVKADNVVQADFINRKWR